MTLGCSLANGRPTERGVHMTYAAITGWGKCMPPAVLTNADLTTYAHKHKLI